MDYKRVFGYLLMSLGLLNSCHDVHRPTVLFRTDDGAPTEVWVGNSLLGVTPFSVSVEEIKSIIRREYPDSDTVNLAGPGFVENKSEGASVLQVVLDGDEHIRFVRENAEIRPLIRLRGTSTSDVLEIGVSLPKEPGQMPVVK